MVEEYNNSSGRFQVGQEVALPRNEWNPVGVTPCGYQLVPVLVYHNIGPRASSRYTLAEGNFLEQMRYLKANGFRVVSLSEFLEFTRGKRQLPRRSVLLTFDDGYRSFRQYASPILTELRYPATLFVQTDAIGAPNRLSWSDLRELITAGYEVQAHSKTHSILSQADGESDTQYAKRMELELGWPRKLFRQHLARSVDTLAYPNGAADDSLTRYVKLHGYQVAFTVDGKSVPSFGSLVRINRSEVYSGWSIEDFRRALTVFQPTASGDAPACVGTRLTPGPVAYAADPKRLASHHIERAQMAERGGDLRQARDEHLIAQAIDPSNVTARRARARLEALIERTVATLVDDAKKALAQNARDEARQRYLQALALDPRNVLVFQALQKLGEPGFKGKEPAGDIPMRSAILGPLIGSPADWQERPPSTRRTASLTTLEAEQRREELPLDAVSDYVRKSDRSRP